MPSKLCLEQNVSLPGSSHCGTAKTNPTSIHEDEGLIPDRDPWVKDLALP